MKFQEKDNHSNKILNGDSLQKKGIAFSCSMFSSFKKSLCSDLIRSFAGADPGGGDWSNLPPQTYESDFIYHDFVQFGKQPIQTNSHKSFIMFELSHC